MGAQAELRPGEPAGPALGTAARDILAETEAERESGEIIVWGKKLIQSVFVWA